MSDAGAQKLIGVPGPVEAKSGLGAMLHAIKTGAESVGNFVNKATDVVMEAAPYVAPIAKAAASLMF